MSENNPVVSAGVFKGHPFEYILKSPGLTDIGNKIFLYLDPTSLGQIQLVCRLWYDYSVEKGLWRRKLREIAPVGSYNRALLIRTGWKAHRTHNSSSIRKDELRCRTLCWKLLFGMKECWFQKPHALHKVKNGRIVRALRVFDNRVIFPMNNRLNVAERTICFDGIQFSFPVIASFPEPHRREVYCMDVNENGILVGGGRDRILSVWEVETGELVTSVPNAHDRLITSVVLKKNTLLSASRDRLVKVWTLEMKTNSCIPCGIILTETLPGHAKSVWGIDFSDNHIVTASADSHIKVWKRNQKPSSLFADLEGHDGVVRNIIILNSDQRYLLSGCLAGELIVWNLETKASRPVTPETYQLGSVISLSQNDFAVAAAFHSHCINLYDPSRVATEGLVYQRTIDIAPAIPSGYVRSITVTNTEIYVCCFSCDEGIIVIDFWIPPEE